MLNFMLVGGIGYIINISSYSLLLIFVASATKFMGYYLWPFAISSLLAITSNYHLNKRWTFGKYKERGMGYLRYMGMALSTGVIDIPVIVALVDEAHFPPTVAVGLTILVTFVVRYGVAKRWVWKSEMK